VRHRQKPSQIEANPPESVMPSNFRTDGFVTLAACAPVLRIVMAIYSKGQPGAFYVSLSPCFREAAC
jgi:hypothetical protein